MKPITFDRHCYRIDGRPIYLHSGEFHYFRVPRDDWRRRMELFRAAGGNCLSTYIPWLIHEPEEGRIVFGGEDGAYDLEGFLQLAREVGLYVIARPGPYQYSELRYDGLPEWLCKEYPQLRAHDIHGRPLRTSSVSYLHPLFVERVRRWYAHVCPIIARHTITRGGPVAFVQLDNELTGIHRWFGSLDYNAETMGFGRREGRYPRFLQARYRDIASLNRSYQTTYYSFQEVRPLLPSHAVRPARLRRWRDYVDFYLSTAAEYLQLLAGLAREQGIDVPLVHNAANPQDNPLFAETVDTLGGGFLLGSDHYYNLGADWPQNNPTPQYAVNVFCSLETLRLFGYPPTVFELPGGSCSDWPPITAHDLRACYLTNLALGMKGANYYVFTGGPNPPGTGTTGEVYDYGAAIGANGEVRPHYQVQKELGQLVAQHPWLVEAEGEFDLRLALDPEYPRAAGYWLARGDFLLSGPEAWELARRGVLPTAFCAGLSPALVDLGADDWLADTETPVVVPAAASMGAAKQERLVRFLERGGRLLIAPVLPTVDEHFEPCTLLADRLGSPAPEPCREAFARVTVGQVANIWSTGDVYLSAGLPAGAEVLGHEEVSGRPVAWSLHLAGGGQAIFLGLRWAHARREHERMLRLLLERLGLAPRVFCCNPNVWTSLRTAGSRSMLFVMNLLSSPMEAEVRCRPCWSAEMIDAGHLALDPMTVRYVELTS